MYLLIMLVSFFLLCGASSVSAEKLGPNPPAHAKDTRCIGTAARKLCVGDGRWQVYQLLGRHAEVEAYNMSDREEVRSFELNRGATACWFRIGRKSEDIRRIECIGL